jgi:hypothetical protein
LEVVDEVASHHDHDGGRHTEGEAEGQLGRDDQSSAEPGGPVAARHDKLAIGGDMGRQCDKPKRGKHDAEVAGDVVIVRRGAAEAGVRGLPDDAGDDDLGDDGQAEQADDHNRLTHHQAQLGHEEASDRPPRGFVPG